MLRRVENMRAVVRRDLLGLFMGGKYPVHLVIGKKEHSLPGRHAQDELQQWAARSETVPVAYGRVGERTYWRYAQRWFSDNEGLSQQEVHALLHTRDVRRGDTINRAKSMAAMTMRPVPSPRTSIGDDVKQLVWHRDGGRCRGCGANSELQFDHVIPLAVGGGSTEDNLQVLCGPCNRRKGASVV